MKIVYASRTGNCESIINRLGIDNLMIESGDETVKEDVILLTYTDGYGLVPSEVESFVNNNKKYIKGVIGSGDTSFGEAYCGAAVTISSELNVPLIMKIENAGTDEDIENLKAKLKEFKGE